jgi:hypothetical protein
MHSAPAIAARAERADLQTSTAWLHRQLAFEPQPLQVVATEFNRYGALPIEIETPAASPPFFNPIFRLLNNAGEEVASNIFAGKGACTGAMTKSMQAKTILPNHYTGFVAATHDSYRMIEDAGVLVGRLKRK